METRDWFLQEWAKLKGKKQAQLVSELDWQKARASKVWNGHIPYKRELVNELADWLGIEPFELLMHPDQAMALRRIKETAAVIVAGDVGQDNEPVPPPVKTGTR